jgi:uncharacterized protein
MMQVIQCEGPQAFLERAGEFLLADEACHNLLLGIPALRGSELGSGRPPYFAAVLEGDHVVAAAMMTPPWSVVLSNTPRPSSARLIAEDLLAHGAPPPGVHAPAPVSERFARAWRELTGDRTRRIGTHRIYRLDRVRPVGGVPGRFRTATVADRAVLVPWIEAFLLEAFAGRAVKTSGEETFERRIAERTGGLHVWEDGGPRTVAGHTSPTPHGIRVGPVYTPPEFRGRGYASACVAALSASLLAQGYRFCCLYTDLANPTSNRIYQRIGYEPVCDVTEYAFVPQPQAPRHGAIR